MKVRAKASTMVRDNRSWEPGGQRPPAKASPRVWAAILLSTWCAMSCGGETAAPQEAGGSPSSPGAGGNRTTGGGAGQSDKAHGGAGQLTADPAAGVHWAGGGGRNAKAGTGGLSDVGGASGTQSGLGGGAGQNRPRDAAADADARASIGGAQLQDGSGDTHRPLVDAGALSPDLVSSAAWSAYKALWRRLDGVAGKDGGIDHSYAGSISATEHDQWLAELANLVTDLDETGLLGSGALTFLRQAATARIEVMRDGGYRYEMFMHRSPLYFEQEEESSIGRLETKIDTLESLRASCLLETAAYQAALEQVEIEALTLYVMDEFAELEQQSTRDAAQRLGLNARDASLPSGKVEGEDLVAELTRRVEEVRAQAGEASSVLAQVELMEERLAAIRQSIASVRVLVTELERCE